MKTKKISMFVLLVISAAIMLTACYKNKNNYNYGGAGGYSISMKNSVFSPASLTVAMGSTVTWMNNDTTVHSVKTSDNIINSGDIAPGSSYSATFSSLGTFNYFDGRNTGMMGTLIVTGSSGGY